MQAKSQQEENSTLSPALVDKLDSMRQSSNDGMAKAHREQADQQEHREQPDQQEHREKPHQKEHREQGN